MNQNTKLNVQNEKKYIIKIVHVDKIKGMV